MKLAIIGSRNCSKINIEEYLDTMPDIIVSGGAKGVDTLAREFANKKGIKLIEYYPDYTKYGKAAPLERNKQIIDDCDSVLAFWNGSSRGTRFTIEYAKMKQKTVKIINI